MIGEDWKITKIIAGVATRLWAASGGALILCFIFYCFYGTLLAFTLFAFFTFGILYHAQDNLLYHPELPSNSRIYIPIPAMHNLPHETITIRTPDNVMLHAFWIRQPEERCKFVPTFIYFHGNAGNMGHRMQNVWGIYYNLHCNILMIEYRGYGLSTGSPSEKGLVTDGRTAVDYLFTRHDLDHTQIVLFGRSLGGAVAIDVASDTEYYKRVMCTIVENTFTNIPEMAFELVHPYVRYVPNCFYKNQFHSLRKVQKIISPSLFVSGLNDTLVPPRMMRQLFTTCGSTKKRLLELNGGSHNDTWVCEGYYHGIAAFLEECKIKSVPLQTPPEKATNWNNGVQDV